MPTVAVCIVTHNSREDLASFLSSLDQWATDSVDVVIVDCGSSDGSAEIARNNQISLPLEVVQLQKNIGFAGGMNVAIGRTDAPYVLSLNADVQPAPDFIDRLLHCLERSQGKKVGAVTGRLVRPEDGGPPMIDAAGMRLTRTWRHLDRGSGAIDQGQYSQAERVFGATGAATLYSRRALDDVAVDGESFLEEFHSFREDAELCFRLQERGWDVLYEPEARAVHRRMNLPERRRQMSATVNYHSLKNRYLLRFYHQTRRNIFLTLIPTLTRDLGITAYVLARERSSLAAYRWLWSQRRSIRERRRLIQSRRLAPTQDVDRWFSIDGEPL